MTHITRRHAAVAGVFAAGLIVAATACGSSGSSGSGSSSGSTSPPSSTSAPATGTGAAVHTVHNASLGTIVVNGKGFTLYRFDVDTAKPPASHCTGGCAALWPAQPASGANSVKGIDHKLIGSVTRGDGTKQLTINGWPVYTYAQDGKAGDTHGQGVGGTWWAVTPTGGKAHSGAGSMSPSGSSSGSSSGGGYGY